VGNPEGKLLPGMTANVKLVVSEKPSVLKVSNAALRFRPPGADAGPSAPSGGAPARGGQSLGGGAPAEGRGEGGREGGRRPSLEEIRERLVKQLALTPQQQAKLDPILQESRQQMMGLRELPEGERRAKAQKIREASRVQIRALLTPEQQAKYDEMSPPAAAGGGGDVATPGRVYVLDTGGKPKAVNVTLGISDGSFTEVVRGELKEGQEVVAGLVGGGGKPGTPGGPKLKL
jgi:HlyD family secretion protein